MSKKIANMLLGLVGLVIVAFVLSQIAASTRSQTWTLETDHALDQPLDPDLEAATTNILRRRALGLHPAFSPIVRRGRSGEFNVRVRGALPVASVAEEVLTRGGVFRALPIADDGTAHPGQSLVGNDDIVDARVKVGEARQPRVDIRLSAPAQARLAEFFRQNPSGRLALSVDGQIGAHATVRELSGPLLVFDPGWVAADGDSAFALAAILDGGPLPVALRVRPASDTPDTPD